MLNPLRSLHGVSLVSLGLLSTTAFGQYGSYARPQQQKDTSAPSLNLSLAAGYARFGGSEKVDGHTFSGGTDGTLVSLDKAFVDGRGRLGYTIVGGWSWWNADNGAAIYEVHARRFFNDSGLGAQVGLIRTTAATLTEFDAFLLYNRTLLPAKPRTPMVYGTVAAGIYQFTDSARDFDGTKPTAFVQLAGRYPCGFGAEASYWYIQTPRTDGQFNRVSVTLSYRF